MARAYKDGVLLAVEVRADPVSTEPIYVVRGVTMPGADSAVPVVLRDGYEYRLRAMESEGGRAWLIERRAVGQGD